VTRPLSTVRPGSCPGRYEDEGEEWDGGEEDEVESTPVVLSLFSGVGGIDLALDHLLGVKTTHMVEQDPYCQRILRRHFPDAEILDDVREVGDLGADIVCGGPPCQAASLAGKQLGEADERWMWPDAIRIVSANRPRLVLFENVSGLLHLDSGRAWAKIVGDLDAAGYATRWDHAEAARAGAPHRRDRIWIVCVPHARWTAPTTAEPVPGSLFGTDAETPAWTRAGWYARGRWGSETARWPRVGAAPGRWPTTTVGDEKNARNRTSGRTNPNSTHADGETLCDAVEIASGKWPTPHANDINASDTMPEAVRDTRVSMACLDAVAQQADAGAGALNPEFSGWLMGAYPGWTIPDGPPLPHTINGWDGGSAGLVYYRGRPAPAGMPLLTTDKTNRRQRIKAHGNGVVPAQAVMAWSVLAGPWIVATTTTTPKRRTTNHADHDAACLRSRRPTRGCRPAR